MDSTASSLLAARDPPEAEFVRDLRLQTKRGDLSVYTMLALTGAQATVFRSLRQSKANLPRSASSVGVGSERQGRRHQPRLCFLVRNTKRSLKFMSFGMSTTDPIFGEPFARGSA